MLAILALLLSTAVTIAESQLSVAPLRWDIADDAVVGRRKSGLLCGPAGRLRWKDVKPDRTVAAERIAAGLIQAGLRVRGRSDNWAEARPQPTRYRLFAKIAAVDMLLCNRQWQGIGLLADRSIKGRIKIDIEWRLYEDASDTLLFQRLVQSDTRLDRQATNVDDAVHVALADNAQRILGDAATITSASSRPRPGNR